MADSEFPGDESLHKQAFARREVKLSETGPTSNGEDDAPNRTKENER